MILGVLIRRRASSFRTTGYATGVLAWLNRNAAAIQALGSIASIVTTVALVWITARYVALTQDLARAAREQLRIQQQSALSETARLITLAEVFLSTLEHLPDGDDRVEQINDIVIWRRGDVTALGTLAASVVGAEAHVRHAIQSLNWLRDKAEQIQQLDHDSQSTSIPWPQWRKELSAARRSLTMLRNAAQAAQYAQTNTSHEEP